MTYRDEYIKIRRALIPVYGNREAEAVTRLVFAWLKDWRPVDMIIHEGDEVSQFIQDQISKIISRLRNGEPIQYITGEARFHGLDFSVTPDVLIPRPETSELVDIITDNAGGKTDLKVLDIGTGSGCIAIALCLSLNFPKVTALDISGEALAVARNNAKRLKAHVDFIHCDVFKWNPEPNKYDIIVSNPPYIDESERDYMLSNVKDFEPSSALFVPDSDSLLFYRRITYIAGEYLSSGGNLYFEINPRHCAEMQTLVENAGFENVQLIRDSYGNVRFLHASKY